VKLHEEFRIPQEAQSLWKFFEQPEAVAWCLPGVESVVVLDEDNVRVRATQSIGPLNATFDARVMVLERVPNQLIRFRATGRSVRGAVGNMRAENVVHLREEPEGTTVVVDGDLILAGALGSVGQKVVARQAGKVAAQFAGNLQRALAGEDPAAPPGQPPAGRPAAYPPTPEAATPVGTGDGWCKVAAGMSTVAAVMSLVSVLRQPKRGRQ
jgi:carbon monoxide dehydrogenase subunit G